MNQCKRIALIGTIASGIAIMLFAFWKYSHGLYNVLDLAIYSQTAWNVVHGHTLWNTIQGASYFGDHIELYLFPVSLLYSIYAHPLILVGIQVAALVSGAIPVYLLAKRLSTERVACFSALAYALHPLLWNNALFEFHFLTFAIPLLLWMVYAYVHESFKLYLLFSLLALAVREDVALVVFGMGLLALLDKRSKRWWISAFVSSVLWFTCAFTINAQLADHGYKFFIFYSWLGTSATEILKTISLHPWYVLSHLLSLSNILFPFALLLLFLGLPLKGLRGLTPAILVFIQLLFGLFNAKTLLSTHYTSLLIPFFIYASILGVVRLQNELRNEKIRILPEFRRMAALIAIIVFVVNIVAIGPLAVFFGHQQTDPVAATPIPKSASVIASYKAITELSARQEIYSLHYVALGHKQFSTDAYTFTSQPEYVVLDLEDLTTFEFQYATNEYYKSDFESMPERIRALLDNYSLIQRDNQLLTMQLKKTNGPSASSLLATVTQEASQISGQSFAVERIVENNSPSLGTYLDVQTSLTLPNDQEWRQLAVAISFTNADGQQIIEAPLAWHLYALNSTSVRYTVRMSLPTNSFAENHAYQIALIKRSGLLQIASHRGTETITSSQETLASIEAVAN